MLHFFRNIRQQLAAQNKPAKYLRYAIGEILLVVIGILIALQINNANEAHKIRTKELIYLDNIKTDLNLNITNLNEFIVSRKETVEFVDTLLTYFEGNQLIDLNDFNFYNLSVLEWYPFVQHSNTFQELMHSGNFAIISNKSIKNKLQNIQSKYETVAFIENEMQQDYERYLYEVYFNVVDLNTALKNLDGQLNNSDGDSYEELDSDEIRKLLKSKLYKNGLVLASFNSNKLLEEYHDLIDQSEKLIYLIGVESGE